MSSAPPFDASPLGVADVSADGLSLARVVSASVEVFRRGWQPLAIIAVCLSGPAALLMKYATMGLQPGAILPPNPALFLAATVISVAVGGFVNSVMLHIVLSDRQGVRPTLGDALATGARLMLPMVGVTLLLTLGATVGAIMLVVPGIIIFLMWSLASPALVVQGGGVFDALRSSRRLTKGSRWKLLALWVVMIVPLIVIQMGSASVIGSDSETARWSAAVAETALSLVFGMVSACATASAYLELCRLKDGVSVDQLAEVFA